MKLKGKKIGILLERDFYENEIFYYKLRFPEEGADLHFLTRLWGLEELTFTGHDYQIPMSCNESFEGMSDEELRSYDAIIVPAGIVADRLRYTEDIGKIPPAAEFMKRAFAEKSIIKGIICHGMWLISSIAYVIKDRRCVVHNNLIWDAKHYGLTYVDEDVVVDDDLVTARTGGHCNLFAAKIIELIANK